jgi:hypothetical protein
MVAIRGMESGVKSGRVVTYWVQEDTEIDSMALDNNTRSIIRNLGSLHPLACYLARKRAILDHKIYMLMVPSAGSNLLKPCPTRRATGTRIHG